MNAGEGMVAESTASTSFQQLACLQQAIFATYTPRSTGRVQLVDDT
jgi:hypothetical protein